MTLLPTIPRNHETPLSPLQLDIQGSVRSEIEHLHFKQRNPGIHKWVLEFAKRSSNIPSMELLANIRWSIWKARNLLIFQSRELHAGAIIHQAVNPDNDFKRRNPEAQNRARKWRTLTEQWRLPEKGHVKFNIDGSIIEGEEKVPRREYVATPSGE